MVYSQKSIWTGLVFASFFLLACFFFSTNTYAQSTISGTIYDKQRNPLPDIDLELQDDLYRTIRRRKTDSTGRYEFDGLANGRYYIRALAFRYDLEDQTQELEINTQNIRGGQGSGFFLLDFYLLPRKGGLVEAELAVVFAQNVPPDAKKLYEKAIDDLSKKKPDEGIAGLVLAIEAFPDYFAALFRIGKELYVQQRYEEAARFLFKAVEVNPKNGTALYYLGSSFFLMGQDYYKAAKASLNQAYILAPNSTQILWALGRVERAQGNYAEAERYLLQAKKLSSSGIPEIHKELAQLYADNLKNYKLAAEELELYIKASKMNDADAKKTKQIVASLREKAKIQGGN
jgi:tetratricopeptide (TPR) repeat protein